MDIGQTRTGADVLAIDGVENYKLVAKTANFIYKFIQGSIGGQQLAIRQNIEMLEPNYHIQN
jgi:hypothetical protein